MEDHSPGYRKLTDWSTLKNNHYYHSSNDSFPLSLFPLYLVSPPLSHWIPNI